MPNLHSLAPQICPLTTSSLNCTVRTVLGNRDMIRVWMWNYGLGGLKPWGQVRDATSPNPSFSSWRRCMPCWRWRWPVRATFTHPTVPYFILSSKSNENQTAGTRVRVERAEHERDEMYKDYNENYHSRSLVGAFPLVLVPFGILW